MCRLFACRSAVPSAVHRSLVRETNALKVQSREHPDGWGIGWWSDPRNVRLERGAGAAFEEADFERVAEVVAAPSVIAHVRKASVGKVGLPNSHPFRRGRWLFAHNGTVARFAEVREVIEAAADPQHRVFEGDTDSERCFALFLTHLSRHHALERPTFAQVADALRFVVRTLEALADAGAEVRSATTFLVGDGEIVAACRRDRTLFFSAHKVRCGERDTCPRHSPVCESPAPPGTPVTHFLLASERMSEEDVWTEVAEDAIVGVDAQMHVHHDRLVPGPVSISA